MNTPPSIGFSPDNRNPYGASFDNGFQNPLPAPDPRLFIVQEAADRARTGRPNPPPRPAAGPFAERFATLERRMLDRYFDPAARIESYRDVARLGDELWNVAPEERRMRWQSLVQMLPEQENPQASGPDPLYSDKADACAALYQFMPQTLGAKVCAPYLDKMSRIMDDLILHRRAGPPALALVRTFEVRVRGLESSYPNYKGIYGVVRKIVDELPDDDPFKSQALDVARKVQPSAYRPERSQAPFVF